MSLEDNDDYSEEFLRRYIERNPELAEAGKKLLNRSRVMLEGAAEGLLRTAKPAKPTEQMTVDELLRAPGVSRRVILETIVRRERPVLFVRDGGFDDQEVTIYGTESRKLVTSLVGATERLAPLLPLIGRIDVKNFPSYLPFVGSGWLVTPEIVVTNRHVADLIAEWDNGEFVFSLGMQRQQISSSFCNDHEYEPGRRPAGDRIFDVDRVLYIEHNDSQNDIAFLKLKRPITGGTRSFIPIATSEAAVGTEICVIGYPARADAEAIPNQAEMDDLYRNRYDVKRAAPGFAMAMEDGLCRHDGTTLGGASGSVVLDMKTGEAVGLHFAGLYKKANYAVPASVLHKYVKDAQWRHAADPYLIPEAPTEKQTPTPVTGTQVQSTTTSDSTSASGATPGNISQSITFPLTVTVSLGAPLLAGVTIGGGAPAKGPATIAQAEAAVAAYWPGRPPGVLAARVGFLDDGDEIGDTPCIAVSVSPAKLDATAKAGPREFNGVPVRFFPADPDDQIQALPSVESVNSIAYDDNARVGEGFSFDAIDEPAEAILHVGPEYSWDVLQTFIAGASGAIVSSIYEFHATHIKNALEARLQAGASLSLVMDNSSFAPVKDGDFDRVATFRNWAQQFSPRFERIVVPEGLKGLISDAYHIKVTVRPDDTFWLSSGNWKAGSSQPIITPEQRAKAEAGEADLPGNREWHVVIKNKTLATRFRNHIAQDFKRSRELGGAAEPKPKTAAREETFIDVPIEALQESVRLERKPPGRVLAPREITGNLKVRPLLTPDAKGAVYANAVLRLIRSAKRSLFFQIPYISMPSNPQESRGFIDDLLGALTEKLVSLPEARVILSTSGSKYSDPTNAAWYFKAKGVKIEERLRRIDKHHTKGMIVDGQRVLLGSHNWSKPGVSLNRDASLIFDDIRVAKYYTDAFQVDWDRSNPIPPRKHVPQPKPVREAVGDVPPEGYRRVALSEWLKDE